MNPRRPSSKGRALRLDPNHDPDRHFSGGPYWFVGCLLLWTLTPSCGPDTRVTGFGGELPRGPSGNAVDAAPDAGPPRASSDAAPINEPIPTNATAVPPDASATDLTPTVPAPNPMPDMPMPDMPMPDMPMPMPDAAPPPADPGSGPDSPGDGPSEEPDAPNPPLPVGLLGHWAMDEQDGPRLDDAGPLACHALVQGDSLPTRAPGRIRKAFVCGGAAAPAGGLTSVQSALTVSAWVMPQRTRSGGRSTVIARRGQSSEREAFWLGLAAGRPGFISDVGRFFVGAPLPDDRWAHLAVTFEGNTLRLYVNGAEAAVKSDAGPGFTPQVGPLTFCGTPPLAGEGLSNRFEGLIDEVRLYARALSAKEVADLSAPGP
ncbi:MAG: LamG domain-containing protein [Myxococcales bacterium]|nr:LamG domain-containing protein [Myxococcales bacterium]